jgi:2,5-diamino-6-(ribosylamino)-4(3H)-pyrimidinone 5'-phosphate reductase
MDLSLLPTLLRSLNVRSVMVEGGASIIDQFLATTYNDETGRQRPLADCVIVTVAPSNIGDEGVAYGAGKGLQAIKSTFKGIYAERFGQDSVLVFQP